MLVEQGSGMVINEAGNKLAVKSILFCKMMPFIITEDGDVDRFNSGKMNAIYQANDQYFDFFEDEARELQAEKSQGILTSLFELLQVVGVKQGGGM